MSSKPTNEKPDIRRWIIPCSVFGGRSPKTGHEVGSRHRWTNGVCDFCHRAKEDVYETVQLIDGKVQRIKQGN